MLRRKGESLMAVVKVIELVAQSPNGWEGAVNEPLGEASKTVDHIQSIYVKELQEIAEDDRIASYRANVKVSFLVQRDES
jgi:flavin-binding protein dodecin